MHQQQVDESLHSDLVTIMNNSSLHVDGQYTEQSFQRIFWNHQKKAASLAKKQSMKWDPLMIRWCLYLQHLSSSSYEMIRQSGVIHLPSQRTLRDYSHHTKACAGFSADVDIQLMDIAKVSTCPDREKCVLLIMDEMHVREDLVYDKHTGIYIIIVLHAIAL